MDDTRVKATATATPAPGHVRRRPALAIAAMAALFALAPLVGFYPVFLMKVLCFALFACAFNLLTGGK